MITKKQRQQMIESGEIIDPCAGINFATLQRDVGQWSECNFGAQDPINPLIGVIEEIGEICANKIEACDLFGHTEATDGASTLMRMSAMLGIAAMAILKRRQGIRGTRQEHIAGELNALKALADFAHTRAARLETALYGSEIQRLAQEAVVEKIDWTALTEEQRKEEQDGIADIDIFMSDYCHRNHHDRQEVVETVWGKVRARDWKKNPENGKESKK